VAVAANKKLPHCLERSQHQSDYMPRVVHKQMQCKLYTDDDLTDNMHRVEGILNRMSRHQVDR